jgi:hypothetical protein
MWLRPPFASSVSENENITSRRIYAFANQGMPTASVVSIKGFVKLLRLKSYPDSLLGTDKDLVVTSNALRKVSREEFHLDSVLLQLKNSFAAYALVRVEHSDKHFADLMCNKEFSAGL